ncbi:MAG TPA: elongation factor P maturation arginine rhamnosyltransferase EarP [Accumulibacter sp.]|jgi:uncharacterized repeat protein (TIGR03837 family)|nr:elongation factor P maturation arginine rhamnosyltransferase EarP [Accumulibacter sp.]HQC80587.1 elongation factor P maturation arginine rhamnosyltransferase EarP [Accumulibacter sp.]
MTRTAPRPDWDIFCQVVDNFGDIGVSWRLARQLHAEHHLRVRLWVDNLATFQILCPQVAPDRTSQRLAGIELRHWSDPFPEVQPAQVVLETFACRLPDAFVTRMARLASAPAWINLDYLSAETWVPGCHTLPSPHPRLPLCKYFYFPGFRNETGGLLRERDLPERRRAFLSGTARQHRFWQPFGGPPAAETLRVSLFAYDNPALPDLLRIWERAARPVCCLVPATRHLTTLGTYVGQTLAVGDRLRRGALEIRVLPFLDHRQYDRLLWACELNFVRGEDSFIRAQWAARPLVWQPYPQDDGAHLIKLDAFLALYCAGQPAASGAVIRAFWQSWNNGALEPGQWQAFSDALPALRAHAERWEATLRQQPDLATQLVRFSRSGI